MPTWDIVAVDRLAARLRLGVDPRRRRQGAGTRLGHGPGASLEFHDHRGYQPGDDLRHLDWGVLARSDVLVLRRHRIEVTPRCEVVLDLSASMASHPAKASLAASLAALIIRLALAAGTRPRLWLLAGSVRAVATAGGRAWMAQLTQATCDGRAGLECDPAPALGLGSERILISDGLGAGGAAPVVRRLGAGAGRISLIAILTRDEQHPQPAGAVHLIDREGHGRREVVLDRDACNAYVDRLARHFTSWADALAGRGAGCVRLTAEDGLDPAVQALLRSGLVATRAADAGGAVGGAP